MVSTKVGDRLGSPRADNQIFLNFFIKLFIVYKDRILFYKQFIKNILFDRKYIYEYFIYFIFIELMGSVSSSSNANDDVGHLSNLP